jgi:predicted ATP-dependent serine protease
MDLAQLSNSQKPLVLTTKLGVFSPLVKFIDTEGEFPRGSIITITGEPGTGKTRYALQIMENIARLNKDIAPTIYSYEMGPSEMSHVCSELNIKRLNKFVFSGKPTFTLDTVCMIDSLDGLSRQEYGSEWPPSELADSMSAAKKTGATIILIHHATKTGTKRSGSVNFAKDNDVTVNLTKSKKGNLILASTKQKCRWPGATNCLELEHTKQGLAVPKAPESFMEHISYYFNKMRK